MPVHMYVCACVHTHTYTHTGFIMSMENFPVTYEGYFIAEGNLLITEIILQKGDIPLNSMDRMTVGKLT